MDLLCDRSATEKGHLRSRNFLSSCSRGSSLTNCTKPGSAFMKTYNLALTSGMILN